MEGCPWQQALLCDLDYKQKPGKDIKLVEKKLGDIITLRDLNPPPHEKRWWWGRWVSETAQGQLIYTT